jgi:hypothetical protein
VQVQRAHDRHLGADQGAYLGQDLARGVGVVLGHHSPVQDQQHAVDRSGSGDPIQQFFQQGAECLGSHRAAGHRPGQQRRHNLAVGRAGEDAQRTGLLGARGFPVLQECVPAQQLPRAKIAQVGLVWTKGVRFVRDPTQGNTHDLSP